ncbi:MAG: bifunctional hydroxymethylpyrimidine kinase/phosphomethylpyrimidine kinase [Myxococcales bacterium]|nr:bifunctional hydroxymethylpyrimidine kinase/phosphomethylpyrimidine kinase [Myxococcales bacterium]
MSGHPTDIHLQQRPASAPRPVALTIAGSDSGGGAGIQADLKTFSALGVYGTSAITALTAQNTRGVRGIEAVSPAFVAAQIDAVASDLTVRATKTGMLGSAAVISAIAAAVRRWHLAPLVVDPVMKASTGAQLLSNTALTALTDELLPLATLVTPNADEAAILVGHPVQSWPAVQAACKTIAQWGPRAVLIKGGHIESDAGESVDTLWDGEVFHRFSRPRLAIRHTHGTGCTFASAIAAQLALGDPLPVAIARARDYVQGAIAGGLALGSGVGPVDHAWRKSGKP